MGGHGADAPVSRGGTPAVQILPLGGAVFRCEWWRYYDEPPARLQPDNHEPGRGTQDQATKRLFGLHHLSSIQKPRHTCSTTGAQTECPELKRIATALIIFWKRAALFGLD